MGLERRYVRRNEAIGDANLNAGRALLILSDHLNPGPGLILSDGVTGSILLNGVRRNSSKVSGTHSPYCQTMVVVKITTVIRAIRRHQIQTIACRI